MNKNIKSVVATNFPLTIHSIYVCLISQLVIFIFKNLLVFSQSRNPGIAIPINELLTGLLKVDVLCSIVQEISGQCIQIQ